ncbi:hypothetical protein IHV10_02170 [Fictibacillus sp. 5RED26]|uniref:hypothetical protein n=1 Tax=Fictibacillus sp. 5RED26 TaxID=2745876 RepID=UPI0018CE4748|nr:hypothetical protein [Fictibacillus sp. 5RED26]MBH0155152.1 hypothetical protein [Fictibacillus sp. 5RED26]
MKKTSEKRLNAFFLLTGILFLYSIFSKMYHFNSILNDIVYALGFIFAILIHLHYRKKTKLQKVDK